MDNKEQNKKVIKIIRKMVEKDRGTIASEIAVEIKKRLNIEVDNKAINALRRKVGLGVFDSAHNDTQKILSSYVDKYQKNYKNKQAMIGMRELVLNMSEDTKFKEKMKNATDEELAEFLLNNGFEFEE